MSPIYTIKKQVYSHVLDLIAQDREQNTLNLKNTLH